MSAASASTSVKPKKPYHEILWAGLIAGILDITAAIVTNAFRGIGSIRIPQSVGIGLLGAVWLPFKFNREGVEDSV